MDARRLLTNTTVIYADPNKDVCVAPYWDDASPYAAQTYLSVANESATEAVRLLCFTVVLTQT